METIVLSAQAPDTARIAADLIRRGELVAIPTETVYGLGANGLEPEAVRKIFAAKGRPQDNPLILHVAEPEQIRQLCRDIPDSAFRLAEAFWPGPLTMVLPARECVPACTTAGLPTVAVRCPDSPVTREIIRLSGVPIAAPSANLSGKPSTTTAQHVFHDHQGRIPLIVDDGPCRVGVESTILDLTEQPPRLLRPGGITLEEMYPIVGEICIDKAVTGSVEKDAVVKAPGMKYRHYAPACQVQIVDGDLPAAAAYIRRHFQPGNRVLCFEEELPFFAPFAPLSYGREGNPDSLLAGLFAALRQMDDPAIGTVFARCPKGTGKALAVQNRLEKAAGFSRVNAREKSCVIGITGGTGCGKSTALEAVRELGGLVFDCDREYHRLLQQDTALLRTIEDRFPGTVEMGTLNRKKLGEIVFGDEQSLLDLNRITHKAVKTAILRQIPPIPCLVALDAIALFESGLGELCDVTVAVTAPEEERIRRLLQRDGLSREQILARMRAQKPEAAFQEACDYVLENNGNDRDFRGKCLAFFQKLAIIEENP